MSIKLKILLIAVTLASTFAFGRYSAPTKTVTEIKTVEVEKKVDDTQKDEHKITQTKEIVKPDGTKETDTTVTDDSTTKKKEVLDDTKNSESKVTVEYVGGNLSVSALVGFTIPGVAPVYGGHIQGRILGPFTSGIWGLSNGVVGVSIGLVF